MVKGTFLLPKELKKEIDAFTNEYNAAEVKIISPNNAYNFFSVKKRTFEFVMGN